MVTLDQLSQHSGNTLRRLEFSPANCRYDCLGCPDVNCIYELHHNPIAMWNKILSLPNLKILQVPLVLLTTALEAFSAMPRCVTLEIIVDAKDLHKRKRRHVVETVTALMDLKVLLEFLPAAQASAGIKVKFNSECATRILLCNQPPLGHTFRHWSQWRTIVKGLRACYNSKLDEAGRLVLKQSLEDAKKVLQGAETVFVQEHVKFVESTKELETYLGPNTDPFKKNYGGRDYGSNRGDIGLDTLFNKLELV